MKQFGAARRSYFKIYHRKLAAVAAGCAVSLASLPSQGQEAPISAAPLEAAPEPPPVPDLPTESSPPSTGQAPAPAEIVAQKITSIEVRNKGAASVDKNRILSNMSLKVGDAFSQEKADEDIKSLFQTGDVENVSIDTTPSGGGVKVVVTVEARASFGEVTFVGNTVFKSSRLQKEIELEMGQSVDDAKLRAAQNTIVELYQKKGFTGVTANYQVESTPQGVSRVIFTIDEGQKELLNNLVFQGNTAFTSRELERLMKVDNRGLKFWEKKTINNDKLDKDIKALTDRYQNAGYINAKVSAERSRVDAGKVDVIVTIQEGEVFQVANVMLVGNKAFRVEDMLPEYNLVAGSTFSARDMKADVAELQNYYGARGYADARVEPRINQKGGGQVDVIYTIAEGGIYTFNKINISGNEQTKDEVIRRELAFDPGEEYNKLKMDVSERRLRGLGYFKDVNLFAKDGEVKGVKDVDISVTEGQTGQLNFGAAFTTIDSLAGFVDFSQSNFDAGSWPPIGGGQRFHANIKAGLKRKDLVVGLTEPWFMGERLALGGELFYHEKTYLSDVFDQVQAGGTIFLRKPVGENSEVRLELTSEQISFENIDKNASQELRDALRDNFHNEIALTWQIDTRDEITTPRKGFKLGATLSAAFGDVQDVGFAVNFAKPILLPWDTIFTVAGSAETVSGSNLPISERLFLGGAREMRGFKYRDVSPKDENGEPLGGDTSLYLSAEYTFPIMERVRGAAFGEVGSVDDIYSDVGVGLRLNLPVLGPLRLDYAVPIQSDGATEDSGRFQVGVDVSL